MKSHQKKKKKEKNSDDADVDVLSSDIMKTQKGHSNQACIQPCRYII